MKVNITVADESHFKYIGKIVEMMEGSSKERGTTLAIRTPEYIRDKMENHKAIIAIDEGGNVAGFSYIETWSHTKFVANSGLTVAEPYRRNGLGRRIKRRIFELSREMYPYAKIFSITTQLSVMKINTELGFKPVSFSELTDDKEFWEGCYGCANYDILQRNDCKICLCTALLYDPNEHKQDKTEKYLKSIIQ